MNDSLADVLFRGETVLWQGKPKRFCYVLNKFGRLLPAAILFLLFDGFFIGTIISTGSLREMGTEGAIFLIVFFAFHLLPVWICISKIITANLEYKNIDYAITSRRIITRTGFIGLDFQSMDYSEISHIKVNVSIIERLCGVGSIIITTSHEQSLCLWAVKDPYALYKKLNEIFIDIKSDVYYPNAYRPDNNPGYNTSYIKK